MLEKYLESLDIDRDESAIYLELLKAGQSTAGVLAKKLGLARPTLYGILQKLTDKGVVIRTLRHGVRSFTAQSPRHLSQLFDKRIEHLQAQRLGYHALLPELEEQLSELHTSPRFQYFEGIEGVQHVLKDMLMYRDLETLAFWPIKSMVEILSPEFFRWHNKERIRNNLYTRAIWPEKEAVTVKDHPYLGAGEGFRREIRVAPTEIHCTMGYWAYKHKAAFLSSRAESFGFIIESQELVTMLRAQFEVVWAMSAPLKTSPEWTKDFLREV